VLALVAGHIRGDRVACRPGYAPSKEVTYTSDNLSGSPICEPCVETSTAYYGNNLRQAPDYGVQSFQACRALCRKEKRCAYFTHDSENSWCYLKTAKTAPRTKKGSEKRYTSGPSSDECESDSENEIEDNMEERVSLKESDAPEKEEEKKGDEKEKALLERERTAKDTKVDSPAKNVTASETKSEIEKGTKTDETKVTKSRVPILSVFHEDGSRTVLTALPATFGMPIRNETKMSGQLVLLPSSLCSAQPNVRLRPWLLSWRSGVETNLFAAVRRGGCRFAKKALHAANAGFAGLVILDDQDNTDTPRISGTHSTTLDSFPVIFLLKTEARILEKHLMETSSLSVTIQDSSTFSWYSRSSTTNPTAKKKGRDDSNGFLMGMRDPPSQWPFGPIRPFRPSRPTQPPRPVVKEDDSVSSEPARRPYSGSILQMSPLTLGSLIVGVLVLLLLITSVTTLLVSRYTRRKRRRANHTRCQLAIRNMEAQGVGSHDNSGFSGGEEGGQGAKGLPKSARNLLECPVCLELAWPPKKIYQCREGHIICEECKGNPALKVCPMCRIPLANNLTSRNRQLEELARALKEEGDGCSSPSPERSSSYPSAPPLTPRLTTLTSSPPIPASVFTVTTSVDIEVGSTTTATAPADEEHEVEEGVGGGRSEGELRGDEGVVRVTSSVAAGPLTVVLPPEYRDHF